MILMMKTTSMLIMCTLTDNERAPFKFMPKFGLVSNESLMVAYVIQIIPNLLGIEKYPGFMKLVVTNDKNDAM